MPIADLAQNLCVVAASSCMDEGRALADRLGVRMCASAEEATCPLVLRRGAEALTLAREGMSLTADFAGMLKRAAQNNLAHELLVKAARVKTPLEGRIRPLAVDATAGLGEDSFLLAAAGFDVVMYESDPVIAALLADALARAATDDRLAPIVSRMRLVEADSVAALRDWSGPRPDVVYLDPMFPSRTKSAAVKKKFQVIHGLEEPCKDPAGMMEAARAARPRKIVVKRPVKGPLLADAKPSHQVSGKAVRYDCYVLG